MFVACTMCLSTMAGAQVRVGSGVVPRDGPRSQPTDRQIPVGTSAISGTVTTTDSGWPVPGAQVTISGPTTCIGVSTLAPSETMWLSRTVVTDTVGRFSFPRLPAGVFRISVSSLRNQFLNTNYGQRRPGGEGQVLLLADGQQLALNVPVLRGGVITGTVRGLDGESLQHVQVRALRADTSNGVKR